MAGWGSTEVSAVSSVLLKANVVPVTNQQCIEAMDEDPPISEGMLCAGEEGKDTCWDDSGGPLISRGPNGDYRSGFQ